MTLAVLRGPLERDAMLIGDLETLGSQGPVALITAGWEEAERNDSALDRSLGGGARNLGLYGRRLDVYETDAEYAAASRAHAARVAAAQDMYRVRLRHAIAAVHEVQRANLTSRRALGTEVDAAIRDVRTLDDAHLNLLRSMRGEFNEQFPPEDRDVIVAHRLAVRAVLEECGAVVVAGGHVTALVKCMLLCDVVSALAERPYIAISSGALALSGRVLVVDDNDAGQRPAEVVSEGCGVLQGATPIPDALHRLRLEDAQHLSQLARRCAPHACVLLDTGDRVVCDDSVPRLDGARVIALDGGVTPVAQAA